MWLMSNNFFTKEFSGEFNRFKGKLQNDNEAIAIYLPNKNIVNRR